MRAASGHRVSIIAILLSVLLAGCAIIGPGAPSSFGVPSVAGGKTVTSGGLAFTVPKSWRVLPGSKYGDCEVTGNAVILGWPGSTETCNGLAIPLYNVSILPATRRGGSSVPLEPIGYPKVRTADVDGVTVTLETGDPVQLGGVNIPVGEKPPSQSGLWPLVAIFKGYNVQFGGIFYAKVQKVGLAPVLAVLDSVRPARCGACVVRGRGTGRIIMPAYFQHSALTPLSAGPLPAMDGYMQE